MAKPTRTILFLAPELSRAQTAANLFAAASGRLGLSWLVQSKQHKGPSELLVVEGVSVVVAIDVPELSLPTEGSRLERMTAPPDLSAAINSLIARLLGGNDAPQSPKPPPPPPPKKVHTVKVSRETSGRKGKGVTVVSELPLNEDAIKELATQLKNKCGTGGTAKDGRIEIQGDHRDKLVVELEKLGYKVKRAGG